MFFCVLGLDEMLVIFSPTVAWNSKNVVLPETAAAVSLERVNKLRVAAAAV